MIVELTEIMTECDAVNVLGYCSQPQITNGQFEIKNLATLALQSLTIPASNADSEQVFSVVHRIKTDFRSSLSTATLMQ